MKSVLTQLADNHEVSEKAGFWKKVFRNSDPVAYQQLKVQVAILETLSLILVATDATARSRL